MRKKTIYFLLFIFCVFQYSCKADLGSNQLKPKQGSWRMTMNLGETSLPFNFELSYNQDSMVLTIINGKEQIYIDDIKLKNDSIWFKLPVFDSEFHLKSVNSKELEGYWLNTYKSADYKIPVKAHYGNYSRFDSGESPGKISLAKKYEIHFSPLTPDESPAIGLFVQEGSKVTGTFATETGDYRYLEGIVRNDSLLLSTFDGAHAYLFKAAIKNDSLFGQFFSGNHWIEPWLGVVNPDFKLKDADSLTFLKQGYDGIKFNLTDANGNMVSLDDHRFQGKVVIVQIMGSWCPNCLDETKYFSKLYQEKKDEGLEIIALAFERTKTKEKALSNLKRLQKTSGATYPFLLGGATREEKAETVLPMLNHIMSYPTAIFIDKKKAVRKIHTGFYGPGTGIYYTDFVNKTERLVNVLLQE